MLIIVSFKSRVRSNNRFKFIMIIPFYLVNICLVYRRNTEQFVWKVVLLLWNCVLLRVELIITLWKGSAITTFTLVFFICNSLSTVSLHRQKIPDYLEVLFALDLFVNFEELFLSSTWTKKFVSNLPISNILLPYEQTLISCTNKHYHCSENISARFSKSSETVAS